MTHPNAELLRLRYDAFANGDFAAVRALLAEDVAWHVPGRGSRSGDYRGHEQVLGFFARMRELSNDTFRIELDDILAERDRVVVLCTVTAERYGQYWCAPGVDPLRWTCWDWPMQPSS